MKNNKKKKSLLFITISSLILAVVIISCYKFFAYIKTYDIYAYRNTKDNPAETIVIKGPARLIAGKSKLKPGFYDISSDSAVSLSHDDNLSVDKGQKRLNQPFAKLSGIDYKKNVTVKLTPSTFKPLVFKDNVAVLENIMGEFEVGKEIPSGDYIVRVKTENEEEARVYLQVVGGTYGNYHFDTDETIVNLHLEEGDYLQINNLSPEAGDFTVIITKTEK